MFLYIGTYKIHTLVVDEAPTVHAVRNAADPISATTCIDLSHSMPYSVEHGTGENIISRP